MEALSKTRYIVTGKSVPKIYMSPRQLAAYEEVSPASISLRIKEIKEQIKAGRYPKAAVMDSTPVKVNFYVYFDYMNHRKRLRDRRLAKLVEPFNPSEIAFLCPIVQEVITVSED